MENAQASAPAPAQVQTPVHPIHQETETVNKLTQWVKENPDNDPHAGTDLEEPADTQQQGDTPEEPSAQRLELDEEAALFDIEYKTDSGKEQKKLSLKELREGYLAKADYMRNIQKVKQQEAEISEKVRQAELQASEKYIKDLETQKAAIQKLAGVKTFAEIEALSRDDPATAQQEFMRLMTVNQTLQGIEQAQQQAAQKLNHERLSQRQQAVAKSWETLSSDIPGWGQEKYQEILKTSKTEYGFDATEVIDAGLLKAIHDAGEFRKLQKAKPEINKRVVTVPKVVRPGSAEQPNPAQEQASRARERLKKTGNIADAAMAYLARQKQK